MIIMKKLSNIIIVIFILALLLVGCKKKTTTDGASESSATLTPVIQPEISAKAAPTVLIGRATDEILNKFSSFYEYGDNGEKIIIWTDIAIINFEFISIGFEIVEGQFLLFPENTLYTVNELLPEKPFVVKMLVSEGIPSSGISYPDEKNIKKYFYISESGKDGSLSLNELRIKN